jgi:hypothetical protein
VAPIRATMINLMLTTVSLAINGWKNHVLILIANSAQYDPKNPWLTQKHKLVYN